MFTQDELKRLLSDRNLFEVSKRTGISYRTIRALSKGKAELVRLDSLEKLSKYFEANNETTT